MFNLIDHIGNFHVGFKKKLNELRETVKSNDDCNIENTILPFLRNLYSISQRTRNLPNLLETFWPEEIECILSDCIENFCGDVKDNEVKPFIDFVFRTGYKDEPDLDDWGSLFMHRTTPLHRAARTYNSKLKATVRELFKMYDRFDANYSDEMGCTHLHVACMYDCRDVVEQFLEHGADPNCIWLLTGDSPLHSAAKYASLGLVESLLRSGAELTLCNKNESTPLHMIVQRDSFASVFEVFDELNLLTRIDINVQDKFGKTPLHLALQNFWFRENSVEALLRRGADPNSADKAGLTPLHVISEYCYTDDLIKMLFKIIDEKHQSVQIEARDNEGNTPLHLALFHQHMSVAKILLRRGADPTVTNLKGLTPLHVICKTDEDDGLVNEFLETCNKVRKTVRIDAPDNLGRTPLQWALASLLPNAVKALLNYGPKLPGFDFPTESQFDECFRVSNEAQRKLKVTSRAMVMVELLERRDYQLDQGCALMIAKLFAKYRLFKESPGLKRFWRNDLRFVIRSKKVLMKKKEPSLSLYDLLQLRPAEAAKQLTYRRWVRFAASHKKWLTLPNTHHESCAVYLGEIMSRKFFQRWALKPFMELIHCRLPILCCEMIIDELMNKDLYHIMVASNRNNTLERNESNDASVNNESNDASERNESNDASERNESNDASERNESNDASVNNESNDASERNESNDASERNESNDSSESNESNDASESNESSDSSGSNKSNDDFKGIFTCPIDFCTFERM